MKDRHLPPLMYLNQLQLEYICSELRSKIYPSKKDKDYYRKVMSFKKNKIEDVSFKNSLPTIFTDEEVKKDFYRQIYNKQGLPNFLYRDTKNKSDFELLDIQHYYHKNSEIKLYIKDKIVFGKIINININSRLVEVSSLEEDYCGIFHMNEVTRIL